MKEQALGLTLFFSIFLMASVAYIHYEATTLRINGVTYRQAGLMVNEVNGDTVYVPIYKRRN